jgi:hypothetical protein
MAEINTEKKKIGEIFVDNFLFKFPIFKDRLAGGKITFLSYLRIFMLHPTRTRKNIS